MIIKFTNYLLKQQYTPNQITILSLYNGQLLYIKTQIRKEFNHYDAIQKVKIVTVDNYQGEENDLILLSCVRSNNKTNAIGFLKESNRVNVALSRAKHGMFIFGNAQFIDKVSAKIMQRKEFDRQKHIWNKVFEVLHQNN